MRKFSNVEKHVIRELTTHEAQTTEGLLQVAVFVEDLLIGSDRELSLLVNAPESRVFVSVPEKKREDARREFVKTITVFNLLRELHLEGRIVLFGESTRKIVALGNQFKDGTTIEVPEPVSSFIVESLSKYILVSEELKKLVDSEFMEPAEVRHKQSMYVAVIALIVSIILGLWGVLEDIILSCT